jgi:hypothetical protein
VIFGLGGHPVAQNEKDKNHLFDPKTPDRSELNPDPSHERRRPLLSPRSLTSQRAAISLPLSSVCGWRAGRLCNADEPFQFRLVRCQ